MALDPHQQIIEAISRARQTLVVFPGKNSEDALAAAVALALIFHKLDKMIDLASAGFNLPQEFKFLPKIEGIKSSIEDLRKFIISLNTEKTKVGDFSYDLKENCLEIYITPRSGFFNQEDVATRSSDFKYDLIISLSSPDIESLGRLYDEHPEFFYKVPVINIDHAPANENYGHINLIDVTACSVSEVIFDLLSTWNRKFIDEDVATALLTGITHKTQSFRSPGLGPRTLSTASQLIALGANRGKVADNLYRTTTEATL